MAYVIQKYCEKCQRETAHVNSDGCSSCNAKKKAEEERIWEAQDQNTKLTDLRKRIEFLESHRYPTMY